MQAVVLAAGEGTRLRPLTVRRPKGLIPVARRPVLGHLVEALSEAGIDDLVVVVGYRREKVQGYLGDGSDLGVDVTYVHQERQVGTAHALAQAEDQVDGTFLVVAGDNLFDAGDLGDITDAGHVPSLLVQEHPEPGRYGNVRVQDGLVQEIVEKPDEPASDVVSTGAYLFSDQVFETIDRCAQEGVTDLPTVLQTLLADRKVRAVRATGDWLDVVHPWDLLDVNAHVLGRQEEAAPDVPDGVTVQGPVTIGEDTTLHPGVVIQGPATIGAGCEVGPHSVIQPSTTIGDNVTIGAHSLVRHSVLMDAVRTGPGALVEDSILAEGVRLGSRVSLVAGPAEVRLGDRVVDLDRFGSVVGDDARFGSHVVATPGTSVGVRARVDDHRRITGRIPDDARVV